MYRLQSHMLCQVKLPVIFLGCLDVGWIEILMVYLGGRRRDKL